MTIKKIVPALLAGVALLHSATLCAQTELTFQLPKNIPVPGWVKAIPPGAPNVWVIDSILRHWHQHHPRPGKGPAAGQEHSFGEEPYLTAYLRWKNQVRPYLQRDGSVRIDRKAIKQYYTKLLNGPPPSTAREAAMAHWTPAGPVETFDAAGNKSNTQTNIYCLAIAPSNPSILYSGSETGVIFRSDDKGLTWSSVSDAIPSTGITALAIDPADANTVYAWVGIEGLVKTTDAGNTWSYLAAYTGGSTEDIEIDPATGRVFIAGIDGVYYSDNGGDAWTLAAGSGAGEKISDISLHPANPSIVYAAGTAAASLDLVMLRSADGGASFAPVTAGLNGIKNNNGGRFGVSPADGNYVYFIALDLESTPRLLKSTNEGLGWTVVAVATGTSLVGDNTSTGLGMSNGQGFFDLDILVSPANANHLIVGTTTAYKSVNGGVDFTPLGGYYGPFALHPDIQCMRAAGGDAYIATDGGVNHSTDFFSTTAGHSIRNKGLTGSDYWGFDQGWTEDLMVGGRYHNGNAVVYEGYGAGNALAVGGAEFPTGHVFHGRERTVGFEDLNDVLQVPPALPGTVRHNVLFNTQWPSSYDFGAFASRLVVDPRYSNTFYVGKENSLLKTDNSGLLYTTLRDFGGPVGRYDICRSNPDVIYVCTESGVYKTSDGGISWTLLTLPAGIGYSYRYSDITVNPANENEVYLSASPFFVTILRSSDGGATWNDFTGTLSAQPVNIAYLLYQGGTDGGVYAIATFPARVFYRDHTMSDWEDFSTNLPANFTAKVGGSIFYRDNKLRLCGNRGVWESPLYAASLPLAQPMADKKFISCSRDTVYFRDHSILDPTGATYQWEFPGASYISSTTAQNPKVLYGAPGTYNVVLTVKDALNHTNTRTVPGMIVFTGTADGCRVDTVPGKCVEMDGSAVRLSLGAAPVNSNHFTITCWVKPQGLQAAAAQVISQITPSGQPFGVGLGFAIKGFSRNLELAYTDRTVGLTFQSGLVADTATWNFIALTYAPTGVTLYLNGRPSPVSPDVQAAIDLNQYPLHLNGDVYALGANYKGLADEIKVYDYALSQSEVREKMHLTSPVPESGLVKYIQFNQFDASGQVVKDLVTLQNIFVPAAFAVPSTAPVGSGVSFRKPDVNGAGWHAFPGTGLDLFLPAGGVYPGGEMVAFRLWPPPDELPVAQPAIPGYWVLHNYGAQAIFTAPDSVRLSQLPLASAAYRTGNFKLFRRPATAFGATWGGELDSSDVYRYAPGNATLLFSTNNGVTSEGQYQVISAGPLVSLPVVVTAFRAQALPACRGVQFGWTTAQEQNSRRFVIERQGSDGRWETIAVVPAAGNSATPQTYASTFAQAPATGQVQYRLVMEDLDGKKETGGVVTVSFRCGGEHYYLYPNPFTNQLMVQTPGGAAPQVLLVYDGAGRQIASHALRPDRLQVINTGPWPGGSYTMVILEGGKKVYAARLFKN